MNEEGKSIVEFIQNQLNKLELIKTSALTLKNREIDIERYIRWKEYTNQLIKNSLGEKEAKNFYFIDFFPDEKQYGISLAKIAIAFKYYQTYFTVLMEGIMDGSIELKTGQSINKRYRVLKEIYNLSGANPVEIVVIDQLEKNTQILSHEMNGILLYLEQRNLIEFPGGDIVRINGRGIDEIEQAQNHPEEKTRNFPPNINFITNIQGDNYGGIQQGGKGNIQNIQININPEFSKAINGLLELIKYANIEDYDKESMTNDVKAINNLAQKEPSQSLMEKFNARIKLLETGLKAADLIGKASPYLPVIYYYFENLFNQAQ